jgi:hypothetical protein
VPQKIAPGDLADLISATCYRRDVPPLRIDILERSYRKGTDL